MTDDSTHAARSLCSRAWLVRNELDNWKRWSAGDAELTAKVCQVDALLECIYQRAKTHGYLLETNEEQS